MIRPKKNGFSKTVGSNSEFDTDECPFCKVGLVTVRDLYNQPNPEDCVKWSEQKSSMETSVLKCPKCGKWFVYWETLDYDYFHLREIEAD
jgi:uncharacterized protein with PIN domain